METKSKAFSEGQYDEVVHVMSAVAALFGYPPPPRPRTLRSNPEWTAFQAKLDEDILIPDVTFYGLSPYARDMLREEAHNAMRILKRRALACKKNKDNLGEAGLGFILEIVRGYLSKVEHLEAEKESGLWTKMGGWMKRKQEDDWEEIKRQADVKLAGSINLKPQKSNPEAGFFKPQSSTELRAIYHTLRTYVLDENISFDIQSIHKVGGNVFQKFTVQKDTSSSASEALEFNKWLSLFFNQIMHPEKRGTRGTRAIQSQDRSGPKETAVVKKSTTPGPEENDSKPETVQEELEPEPGPITANPKQQPWEAGKLAAGYLHILECLPQGGLGLSYRALHKRWEKVVMIKTPVADAIRTERAGKLFAQDAQAWISLGSHPNIATCYYVQEMDGLPRLVIEYLDGGCLRANLASGEINSLKRALDIGIQIACAMIYAHSKGTIHRDLKPSNCLMSSAGQVKVTDFGLARWASEVAPQSGRPDSHNFGSHALQLGNGLTGSPQYMAPELWGRMADESEVPPVSWATDIYAFGVILFETICGSLPYRNSNLSAWAWRKVHKEEPAQDPSWVRAGLSPELSSLLLRCLEKNPADRYGSFEELVKELRAIYQTLTGTGHDRRASPRLDAVVINNQALCEYDAGFRSDVISLLDSALQIDPGSFEANWNKLLLEWRHGTKSDGATVQEFEKQRSKSLPPEKAKYFLARLHLERREPASAEKLLRSVCKEEDASPRAWSSWADSLVGCGRHSEAVQAYQQAIDIGADAKELRYHAEAALYLAKKSELAGHPLFPPGSGPIYEMSIHKAPILGVAMSPSGSTGISMSGAPDSSLRIWNLHKGESLFNAELRGAEFTSMALGVNGRYLLTGSSDKKLRIWNVKKQERLRTSAEQEDDLDFVALFEDQQKALSISKNGLLCQWDLEHRSKAQTLIRGPAVQCFAVSKDGLHAVSSSGNSVIAWNLETRKAEQINVPAQAISSVAISADGQFALTGSADNLVRLWDFKRRKLMKVLKGHRGPVLSVEFGPDDTTAVSVGKDNTLRVWALDGPQCVRTLEIFAGNDAPLAISSNGRFCLAGGWDTTLRLVDLGPPMTPAPLLMASADMSEEEHKVEENVAHFKQTANDLLRESRHGEAAEIIRSARRFPGYDRDTELIHLNNLCGTRGRRMGLKQAITQGVYKFDSPISALAFGRDPEACFLGDSKGKIRYWDTVTGNAIREWQAHSSVINTMMVSQDRLITGSGIGRGGDNSARVWDKNSDQPVLTYNCLQGITSLDLSPGRRQLLLGCREGLQESPLRLVDIDNGEMLAEMEEHGDSVTAVAIHPSGRFALSGGMSGSIRMWHLEAADIVATPEGHPESVVFLRFLPDGKQFVSCSLDGDIRFWDTETCELLRSVHADEGVLAVDMTADGRFMFTGSASGKLHFWHTSEARSVYVMDGHSQNVKAVCFSRDGYSGLSSDSDGNVHLLHFDWEYEFPESDSSVEIIPILKNHLTLQSAMKDTSNWSEEAFNILMENLTHSGFGFVTEQTVRMELRKLQER
ncbi:MAG: protein kinase [Planctomycetota bacterium]|nr:protein kinase [Planctomycetota bacterium]